MTKKAKLTQPVGKSLFDDLDSLIADFDSTINEMERVGNPKQYHELARAAAQDLTRRDSMRPNLPPHSDKDFYWNEKQVLDIPAGKFSHDITIQIYLDLLQTAVPYFVWNDLRAEEDKPIRAWSKLGYTFDPATAVLLQSSGFHFSLCLASWAAFMLGMSSTDQQLLSFVCWNWHPQVLATVASAVELRQQIIDIIKQKGGKI